MTKNIQSNQAIPVNQAVPVNQAIPGNQAVQDNQLLPSNESLPENEVVTNEFNEFCSPAFIDPNGRLPRIQAVRGEDPKQFGYFVPFSEMASSRLVRF
ncbi:DUF5895 domain-containing protein [Ancylothrix sp. C2]|uniref:DUF5895 domain-containing protein n=1 Tax=Ancylothrix sp. D3o TaxID=2953691 RepID=UPI0021BAE96B|nr:DUF5895 domain-containing protein [Ancylothrix sp. D3o]MCT7953627.1 DUF5895 domain-containing protein [Ancylothrix sp. D3o]